MRSILAVSLAASLGLAQAPNCAFSTFGRPCGGTLSAQLVRTGSGPALRFDVANAAPGSFAILCAGQRTRPVALPNSSCFLLVDPRVTSIQQVDRQGTTAFRFALPPVSPLGIDFQVVTVAASRSGRLAASTNGVELNCR